MSEGVSRTVLSATVIFLLLVAHLQAYPADLFDPTDLCILTCDQCFKNQVLLNCANHCLATAGQVSPKWTLSCPLFNNDQPIVNQI